MLEKYKCRGDFLFDRKYHGVAKDIYDAILEKLQELFSDNPPALLTGLCLDICYFCLRHYRWRKGLLFGELLKDFIAEEYLLSHSQCENILSFVEHVFAIKTPNIDGTLSATDEDYLRYLFVSIATAKGYREALTELAVSRRFLAKIQSITSEVTGHTQSVVEGHPDGVDDVLTEIISHFISHRKMIPWILQLYKLYYLLDFDELSIELCGKIYEVLLVIAGNEGGAEEGLLNKSFERLFRNESISLSQLVGLLSKSDLIYQQGGKNKSWYATQKAYAITSYGFAAKLLRQKKVDYQHLKGKPLPFQVAVIEKLAKDKIEQVLEGIIFDDGYTAPEVLYAGIKRVLEVPMELAVQVKAAYINKISSQYKVTRSSGRKLILLEAMALFGEFDNVEETLRNLYTIEKSDRVKHAMTEMATQLNLSL